MRTGLARWGAAMALAWHALAAHALDPRIALDGYRHERWGESEGAPQSIEALAQGQDGWLWLASGEAGLFRFDGVRFYPFVTRDGSQLLQRTVTALRPGPGNTLWIGYAYGGLTLLRNGRYEHVAPREAIGSSFAIALDTDGVAWVAGAKGLFAVKQGKLRRVGPAEGFHGAVAQYVLADRHGRIWVSDGSELLVRQPGSTAFEHVRHAPDNPLLLEDAAGAIWLVTRKDFERVAPSGSAPPPAAAGRASSFQSLFDAHGNLWSGNCPVGLCRLRAAERGVERFSALGARERWDKPWQMHSLRVLSLLEDGDGSVWIGTASGLERLRDQPVHIVPELFDQGMIAAAPHPDGSIRAVDVNPISGKGGMWRVQDGHVTALPNDRDVEFVGTGPAGVLLLAGPHGIERHGRDGVRHIPLPELPPALRDNLRIRLVAEDAQGGIWLRIAQHGTRRYVDGRWLPLAEDTADVLSVASDAAGRIYQGRLAGRLRVVDGANVREYGPRDGLGVGEINFVHAGAEVLVSGNLGAQVLHGGRFHPLTFALPQDVGAITGIVTGPDGERWLNGRAGLLRVTAPDWAATMADPARPLRATLYAMQDGFPGGGAENNRRKATAFAGPDGRLWFVGRRALAWVWPRELPVNPATPAVEILDFVAGRTSIAAPDAGQAVLPAGTEDVHIDYTAPSLRLPQRVTFRYRLLGARAQWEEAGNRRSAFYTRLGPGDYTFEVVAVNESGIASAQPTRLAFRIAPHWTQTPWFYAGCAALVLALATLAYRWRLRLLAARIEERHIVQTRERERIARSLHDTFLQSVQGLVLSVHAVMMKLPRTSTIHAELARVLARADDVLAEGRNEVKGLRGDAGPADDFRQALESDLELVVPGALRRVTLQGAEHFAALRAEVRHEAYAIAREALANALRHTAAPVRLRLDAQAKTFVLEVADTGPGLGPFAQGRAGHFGLAGMRERAGQVGAALRIDSSPAGVTVTLSIPAALAYEGGRLPQGTAAV